MTMKKLGLALLFGVLFLSCFSFSFAQTASPTPGNSQNVTDLQNKINDLKSKISDLQGQEKTLSSQIAVYDSQIKLTELQIQSTEQQINDLTLNIDTANKKINNVEKSLDNLTKVLINRIIATYEIGSAPQFQTLIASSNFGDFVKRANYLRLAQAHDKKLIYDTVQAKNDYANQKDIYQNQKKKAETLQEDLENYSTQLDSEKKLKADVLAQTQGSESEYQRILAQTQAQLAGFQGFVSSQGGASLLGNQTTCDDWGCYYNQRDSSWGGNSLNGTQYTLASDGCLITSMAMIYTHYGHRDVNPQTINSNGSNFSGIPAALLRYSITANGVSSSRIQADIDSTLSSGNPVVVGISYDGGPLADHFVVFVSGSGGNYTMKDPFTPNGSNIDFRGRYPNVRIVESDKVVF
jgi:peptidoglycan hydrolase CwlO-like protein